MAENGFVMLRVQWFYRPEDMTNEIDVTTFDAREIFYSTHKDEVPAETIMHSCTVQYITQPSDIPNSKENPGFIVQKLYNIDTKGLVKLTAEKISRYTKNEITPVVEKTN